MTNNVLFGVYVHIPFCKSRCAYCSFVSCTNLASQQLYVTSLVKEINSTSVFCDVDSVYIGGGTPSMLKSGLLSQIFDALNQKFNILPSAEITVEANPDSFDSNFACECAQFANRLSLGLQSANDDVLKAINRPHTYADFLRAIDLAQKVNIKNISCDLMLGLPSDTIKGVKTSLNKALDLPIKHLSLYALKLEEGTPLQNSGYNVDDDLQADMYDECYNILQTRGLQRYEVSNFAFSGYESKHNLKYWFRKPYIGFGAAAHSFYNECRQENTSNISKYIVGDYGKISQKISLAEQAEEYIMLSLRTKFGLNFKKLLSYGVDIKKIKDAQITKLKNLNMIQVSSDGITLTPNAYYVMNSIIVDLLP